MKLYYSKGACSLAVRIVIHEIDIPCYFESVQLKTKKTETGSDYFEVNPKGAVPALVLNDGAVLTENAVIQQYLADTHKANELLPPVGEIKRYHVLEWLNFVSTELHKGCSPFFNASIPEEIKDKVLLPALKNKLQFVDDHLKQSKYLTGETFTLADGYCFVILTWLPGLRINLIDYANINRYFNELKHRPSIIKALAEES